MSSRQIQLRKFSEQEVVGNIQEKSNYVRNDLRLQEMVLEVLAEFENKSISKRIATRFETKFHFQEGSATVEHNYGMWHLNIYTKRPDSYTRDKRQFFLGYYGKYDSEEYGKTLLTSRLNDLRCAYARDAGRLAHYEAAIAKVPEWVVGYNEAVEKLQVVFESMREMETEYSLPLGHLFD